MVDSCGIAGEAMKDGDGSLSLRPAPLKCPCDSAHFSNVFTYEAPPEGEIPFRFSSSEPYRREIRSCDLCGHFVSLHEMDNSLLYSGDYVTANYRDLEGIRRSFERVNALDPELSDNVERVQRVLAYGDGHFKSLDRSPSILDVGSGLCVFLYRMKAAGWECTALDQDERLATHAQEVAGVISVCGDFMAVQDIGHFDMVTFNKVLEHVEDPVAMLAKSVRYLHADGLVYVEVPDGEMAAADGQYRNEFFIDHLHVFSAASLALLGARAGFALQTIERLQGPSGKHTLRAFLVLPEVVKHETND